MSYVCEVALHILLQRRREDVTLLAQTHRRKLYMRISYHRSSASFQARDRVVVLNDLQLEAPPIFFYVSFPSQKQVVIITR